MVTTWRRGSLGWGEMLSLSLRACGGVWRVSQAMKTCSKVWQHQRGWDPQHGCLGRL